MRTTRQPLLAVLFPLRWQPWRRRIGGTLMVAVTYSPYFAIPPQHHQYLWLGHSVSADFSPTVLPGMVLVALLAPRVGYRRRDVLTLCVLPVGIRTAWIIGTRLAQLPNRTWPERLPGDPLDHRPSRLAPRASRQPPTATDSGASTRSTGPAHQ